MVGERDIVAVSIPFVSGVAFAAVVPWDGSLHTAAGVACGAVAALLVLLRRHGGRRRNGWRTILDNGLVDQNGRRSNEDNGLVAQNGWRRSVDNGSEGQPGRNYGSLARLQFIFRGGQRDGQHIGGQNGWRPGGRWRDVAVAAALYFCLGAWCWLTASLRCGGGVPPEGISGGLMELLARLAGRVFGAVSERPPLTERALTWFQGLIDGCGLRGEESAALLKALLTGQRKGLARATVGAFRSSGAAHILALSGLHLGVVYGVLTRILAVLGRSRPAMLIRSLTAVAACGFYCMMCGAGPSLVRAFLFICINEFARHSPGRHRDPIRVLCAALMIQLVVSPGVIASLGFQLSYLSIAGLFIIFPRLDTWYPTWLFDDSRADGDCSKRDDDSSRRDDGCSRPDDDFSRRDDDYCRPDDDYSRPQESESRKRLSGSILAKIDIMRRIWSSVALSISCQLFTAPVVWFHFHTFPKYFLITNLIALPLTEVLIVTAVLTLCLSAFGVDVHILTSIVDFLSDALISALHIISEL